MKSISHSQTINAPHDTKQKDNIEYNEYRGDEVHDKIYRSILKQTYRMFRLFCGSFQNHIPAGQGYSVVPQGLIDKLKEFYVEVSTSFESVELCGSSNILLNLTVYYDNETGRQQHFGHLLQHTVPSTKRVTVPACSQFRSTDSIFLSDDRTLCALL